MFRIEDPYFDIASTIIDMSILGPILLPQYGVIFNEKVSDEYLDFYQEKSPVDSAKLEHYQAFTCLVTMAEYARGDRWTQTPGILEGVLECFKNITGIEPIPD